MDLQSAMPMDLRALLDASRAQVEENLGSQRRVMIMDLINQVCRLDREEHYECKDAYARLLIILNSALRAGKVYYDEL